MGGEWYAEAQVKADDPPLTCCEPLGRDLQVVMTTEIDRFSSNRFSGDLRTYYPYRREEERKRRERES